MISEKNVALFEKYNVLKQRELESRHEVALEQYEITINIEAETTESLARTVVLPAAVQYLSDLAKTIVRADNVGLNLDGVRKTAQEVGGMVDALRTAIDNLITQNKIHLDDLHETAVHKKQNVIPAMEAVRHAADDLERAVPHDMWSLPTYREILFVK